MPQRKRKPKKKKPTFSKKDWKEILNRLSMSLITSMLIQQFKNVPFGKLPKGAKLYKPEEFDYASQVRTPNPAFHNFKKRRKS